MSEWTLPRTKITERAVADISKYLQKIMFKYHFFCHLQIQYSFWCRSIYCLVLITMMFQHPKTDFVSKLFAFEFYGGYGRDYLSSVEHRVLDYPQVNPFINQFLFFLGNLLLLEGLLYFR